LETRREDNLTCLTAKVRDSLRLLHLLRIAMAQGQRYPTPMKSRRPSVSRRHCHVTATVCRRPYIISPRHGHTICREVRPVLAPTNQRVSSPYSDEAYNAMPLSPKCTFRFKYPTGRSVQICWLAPSAVNAPAIHKIVSPPDARRSITC
jgi:hypothetical protein